MQTETQEERNVADGQTTVSEDNADQLQKNVNGLDSFIKKH